MKDINLTLEVGDHFVRDGWVYKLVWRNPEDTDEGLCRLIAPEADELKPVFPKFRKGDRVETTPRWGFCEVLGYDVETLRDWRGDPSEDVVVVRLRRLNGRMKGNVITRSEGMVWAV
jgi:hypothetical protein